LHPQELSTGHLAMIVTHRRHNCAGVGDRREDDFALDLGVREAFTDIKSKKFFEIRYQNFFNLKLQAFTDFFLKLKLQLLRTRLHSGFAPRPPTHGFSYHMASTLFWRCHSHCWIF